MYEDLALGTDQGVTASEDFAARIAAARDGDQGKLGELFAPFWRYMWWIAGSQVSQPLQGKFAPSDLVQESMLLAYRAFPDFRGTSEAELKAWLLRIMENCCVDWRRAFIDTGKRDVGLEVGYEGPGSALGLNDRLDSMQDSPSVCAIGREDEIWLSDAVSRLPDDLREALRLRSFDGLRFKEIGQRLGRSEEAARKLWSRAIQKLGEDWNLTYGRST